MSTPLKRCLRYGGLLLGSSLAGALLWSGAMPPNALAGSELPAQVTFTSTSTALLAVNPAGDFISEARVVRGSRGAATGSFVVHNPSIERLDVRLRADPSSADLDAVLQVSVSAGNQTIYSGPLGGLRRKGTSTFTLEPDRSTRVSVRAWVPSSMGDVHQARVISVPLKLQATS